MIQTSRRGFITGLVSFAVTAPAIVKATSLMPVKSFIDETALARAMRDYIEKMVNPALTEAMQDFLVFGTGALEFTGTEVRHVPLEQLHVNRDDVLRIAGIFPGLRS